MIESPEGTLKIRKRKKNRKTERSKSTLTHIKENTKYDEFTFSILEDAKA